MSRKEWIIGIIAGLLISGLVIAFLVFVTDSSVVSGPTDSVSAAPASTFQGSTSKQAYELAKEEAAKWQPDAHLVKANTTWLQGTTRDQLLSGENSWTLGFYSPSNNAAANFEVLDGQAELVNEFNLDQSLSPEDVNQWRIDSKVAVYRLLDEGGDKFLNRNGISSMTMSLSLDGRRDRPEWLLLLLGTKANDTFSMRLDATTGEVLETIISS